MSISSLLHTIAPQFDSIASRNDFIFIATLQVNRDWFGDTYELAAAYLTAHLITVNTNSSYTNGSGAITSKREGDLSVSYSAPTISGKGDDDLIQTGYGRQFLRLRNQKGFMIEVTGKSL